MTVAHKYLGLCSCAALATPCFKTWRLTRLEGTDCFFGLLNARIVLAVLRGAVAPEGAGVPRRP